MQSGFELPISIPPRKSRERLRSLLDRGDRLQAITLAESMPFASDPAARQTAFR